MIASLLILTLASTPQVKCNVHFTNDADGTPFAVIIVVEGREPHEFDRVLGPAHVSRAAELLRSSGCTMPVFPGPSIQIRRGRRVDAGG